MNSTDQTLHALEKWLSVVMQLSVHNLILYSKENNISMSQVGALFHIHRHSGCGVSDIGEGLGITSAAASQMLDRLVQQDLLERSEDPGDRRVRQIALTPKGQAALQAILRARQRWLNELAQALTPAEQAQVTAALTLLSEKAGQLKDVARQP